jgi:hypothetical protein
MPQSAASLLGVHRKDDLPLLMGNRGVRGGFRQFQPSLGRERRAGVDRVQDLMNMRFGAVTFAQTSTSERALGHSTPTPPGRKPPGPIENH